MWLFLKSNNLYFPCAVFFHDMLVMEVEYESYRSPEEKTVHQTI